MIGYLYIQDFPAWVIARQHSRTHKTAAFQRNRIVSRTPDLAEAGLMAGTPLDEARSRFQGALFESLDPVECTRVWHEVIQEVYALTPFMYPIAPGQLVFRYLTSEEAVDLAEQLHARVGCGENLSTAKFAAMYSLPGQLTDIPDGMGRDFLATCSIDVLRAWLFNTEILDRLEADGYSTLGTVIDWTLEYWISRYGEDGRIVFTALHPPSYDRELHNFVPPVSIRRSLALSTNAQKNDFFAECIASLVRNVLEDVQDIASPRLVLEVTPGMSNTVMRYSRSLQHIPQTEGEYNQLLSTLLSSSKTKKGTIQNLTYTLHGFAPTPFSLPVRNKENHQPSSLGAKIPVSLHADSTFRAAS
ncbi:MAG TPA: hypothetical protein DIW24_06030 [Bacteroidetes bacterium]|nr:hypothetical protein [Bacteroidota bacterium]HRR07297.1 hypothetical protein [Rhodothermales bacterium]